MFFEYSQELYSWRNIELSFWHETTELSMQKLALLSMFNLVNLTSFIRHIECNALNILKAIIILTVERPGK